MKKLLSLLMSFVAAFSLFAQSNPGGIKKFYVDFGAGAASHNGASAQIGATAVLKNNWTISASYYDVDANPKNLPSDYEQGCTILLIFPIPDPMPSANLRMLNFTTGKYFELGRKTWFTTEAGLSIVSGQTFQFASQPIKTDCFYVSSNYSVEEKSKTTLGGMFRGDFNWAFSRFVGFSAGAFANVNSIQSPVGFEVKLIAGWLNNRKKVD